MKFRSKPSKSDQFRWFFENFIDLGTPLLDDQLDEDTELGESLLQTQEIVATKLKTNSHFWRSNCQNRVQIINKQFGSFSLQMTKKCFIKLIKLIINYSIVERNEISHRIWSRHFWINFSNKFCKKHRNLSHFHGLIEIPFFLTRYRHVPNSLDDSLVGPEGPMGDSLLETDEAKKLKKNIKFDEHFFGKMS